MFSELDRDILLRVQNGYCHVVRACAQRAELSIYLGNTESIHTETYLIAMHARNFSDILRIKMDISNPISPDDETERLIVSLEKLWEKRNIDYRRFMKLFDKCQEAYFEFYSRL